MYRDNDKKQSITHINFIFDDVGIGDAIAALPALKYIYDNHSHIIAHIWVPDYFYDFICASFDGYDRKKFIIRKLSQAKGKYNDKLPGRSFKLFNYIALATHPTTTAFLNFINREVTNNYKNYLQLNTDGLDKKFNLPEKYVVVTVAYTTDVRQWLPEYINKTVDFIKEKGYDIVYLGKEQTYNGMNFTIQGNIDNQIDFSKGLNLLGKTNLLEAREIINNAHCIVGLDNGLIHLAGTTDVPIVVGYTTVDPITRMPYRHNELGWNVYPVVPPQSLSCRFCQTNMNLTLKHDFRNCYYGDRKCVYELTPELFIEQLNKIL